MMQFSKAERKKAKLRLGITGPSGSGKTLSALMIAKGLGGKLAVIDTERGSASLYSEPQTLADGSVFDPPQFDALELTAPFSPERYREAIALAEANGYEVLIVDSASHEWSGSGGCLEINEQIARAKYQGNTWSAWNETTPRHRKFIDAMLESSMHIICTGRSKTETAQVLNDQGKKKIVKLGMKTEQRDGFEYEFTVVLDMQHETNYAVVSKNRTDVFGSEPELISEQTGVKLRNWLDRGAVVVKERDVDYDALCNALDHSIEAIKEGIANGDLPKAAEAWFELEKDEKEGLWRAPTKGGIFTTEERRIIASAEFREAKYGPGRGNE